MTILVNPGATTLSRPAWLLLVAYAGTLLLFNLGGARSITHHESHNVQAAREMLASGDWLMPRIGGRPWLEKPPLPQWCIAVVGGLVGDTSAWLVRLPSALAGLLAILLIAQLAACWFGPTVGLLAGLVQATTIYTVTYARLAEADIYLWLLIVACLSCFARRVVTPAPDASPTVGRWSFFLLLGLTNLAKGLLFGTVVVLLPCLAYLVVSRNRSAWRWFLFLPGFLLVALVAAPWPLAVAWFYPETLELWRQHYVDRMAGDTCYNPEPIWYYLTTLPWQVLPWTLVVPLALPGAWRRAWREKLPADRFLWLWLAAPLLALSLAQAKHHHYLIYALPPCSIWAALGLVQLGELLSRPVWRLWVGRVGLGLLVLMTLGWIGLLLGPRFAFWREALWLTGLLLLMGVGIRVGWALGSLRISTVAIFAGLWALSACVHAAVMPRTDTYRQETAMLMRFADAGVPDKPIVIFRVDPARILVYLPAEVEPAYSLKDLRRLRRELGPAYLITAVAYEDELRKAGSFEKLMAVEQPRVRSFGAASQMAIYRMNW